MTGTAIERHVAMSFPKSALSFIGAVALVGGSLPALAAAPTPADRQFAQQAHSINQAEIDLGKMAQQKGTTADVKGFGAQMVVDHTNAQKDLDAAARKDGVTVHGGLSPEQKQLEKQLSGLSGKQFDDAYMKHMATGHTAAVKMFKKEVVSGTSPALHTYASQALPMLEHHEHEAGQMEHQGHP
jgi:putative membrane protein